MARASTPPASMPMRMRTYCGRPSARVCSGSAISSSKAPRPYSATDTGSAAPPSAHKGGGAMYRRYAPPTAAASTLPAAMGSRAKLCKARAVAGVLSVACRRRMTARTPSRARATTTLKTSSSWTLAAPNTATFTVRIKSWLSTNVSRRTPICSSRSARAELPPAAGAMRCSTHRRVRPTSPPHVVLRGWAGPVRQRLVQRGGIRMPCVAQRGAA